MQWQIIHVSILLQCPDTQAFNPFQAVPLCSLLTLARGLSPSGLFPYSRTWSRLWLSTPAFGLSLSFSSGLPFVPRQQQHSFPSASSHTGRHKERVKKQLLCLSFLCISSSFALPQLASFPPSPTLLLLLDYGHSVHVCIWGGGGWGGYHLIITNQKDTGGSCHRNLVHGSRRPSYPPTTNRIAYHIMIIISFLRQKKEKERVEGWGADYRP